MSKKQKWFVENINEHQRRNISVKKYLVRKKFKSGEVVIADTDEFGRCIFLNGAMRCSESDEALYHKYLLSPLAGIKRGIKEALVLGGSAGAAVRELLKNKKIKRVYYIDSDESALNVCRKYFNSLHCGAFNSPRTRLIIGDAEKFIGTVEHKYDLIICDMPKCKNVNALRGCDFYKKIKNRLREGGMFVMSSRLRDYAKMEPALAKCFKYRVSNVVYLPSFAGQYVFTFCGSKRDLSGLEGVK